MTKKYEQRKESNKNYLSNFESILYRVPKGEREELQKFICEHTDRSMNQFITDAIEYYKNAIESGAVSLNALDK